MGTALVLLGTIAAGMAGTAAVYRLAQNFQPGKGKLRRDLADMQEEIQVVLPELVSIRDGELELLSRNQIHDKQKRRIVKKARGVFTSIYQEPMIAWARRTYLGSDRNALVYARTANHSFYLRVKTRETEISINDRIALRLFPDGKLTDGRGRKTLGFLRRESEHSGQWDIVLGKKEAAGIQHIPETSNPQPRVFYYVAPLDDEERLLVLAMTIAYLTEYAGE